jgi:hypothetical protein
VLFDCELFRDEADRANSQKRILALLEALVMCNRLYLRQNPDTPLIYQSGIRYIVPEQFERAHLPEVDRVREWLLKKGAPADVREAFMLMADQLGSGEHFREIPRILEHCGGDCDNVAAWRCAELRELGISAKPYITWRKRPDGGTTYHVIVRWPDGSSEDPSLLLGMGGSSRATDRAEEERKLGDRVGEFMAGLTWTRTLGGGLQTLCGDEPVLRRPSSPAYYYPGYYSPEPFDRASSPSTIPSALDAWLAARMEREDDWRNERDYKKAVLDEVLGVVTPQNFSQLQYTIPFQDDDSYEDWSPTRPQAFYAHPLYPNLPSTPGGGPIFNTRLRDPDEMDWDDKFDRFDGSGDR